VGECSGGNRESVSPLVRAILAVTAGGERYRLGDYGAITKVRRENVAAKGCFSPPAGLWWDAKGDWKRAHESAQQDEGPEGSWVHAYLHRKEGDQGNAAYWYGRAGKPVCREPLDAEWLGIVRELLR
jgi:hypothetical protein